MLDYIRKRSGGFISIFIVGAIALVFVFWGIGGQNTGDGISIRIDDAAVPITEYQRVQRTLQDTLRQENPGLEGRELELASARAALSTLVQRHVLGQLASEAGVAVPPEAVVSNITSNQYFQENGRFSKARYETMVQNAFGQTVPGYEAALTEDLRLEGAIRLIQRMNFVPKASLLEDYHTGEDEIALAWAYFPASAYAEGLTPSQEDLAAYYEANRERWRRPAQVKVEYVTFDPQDYRASVTVTDDEIAELYQEELPALSTPASAEVSHILFKFPSFTPTEEQKAETRAKAERALERAASEDFAALARELSEDPGSASQGGELPTVKPGDMVQEFERAVFDSTPEQRQGVIGPVETMFGYHLIKVRDFSPPAVQTLAEARPALAESLTARKSRTAAGVALEELLERAQSQGRDGPGLIALAESMGLKGQASDFFGEADPPAFLGGLEAEARKAVSQPVGLVSDPVDGPELLALYTPVERRESFVPAFSDPGVEDEIKAAWTADASLRKAGEAARALIAGRGGRPLDAAAKALGNPGIETGVSGFFRRLRFFTDTQPPLSQGDLLSMAGAIFSLRAVGDTAPEPVPTSSPGAQGGFLVLGLNGQRAAAESAFAASEGARRQSALQDIAQGAYTYWTYARTAEAALVIPPPLQRILSGQED
ncbi:MAG: SurA N-terminal domain-containing protein [Deltaproteobacteria bacterium]|jgi:peptidyl-prolyl cis-trans isomerase D|nr:SurA N-terminal domain-containing protein [Deltaproteobacteria bacterium]